MAEIPAQSDATTDKPGDQSVVLDAEKSVRGKSDGSEVADEAEPRLHAKTFLAVFAVALIYFAQLFSLIGAGAQGQTIAGHFGASDKTSWLSAVITIMTVVLGPIFSQAADYWGRKWFIVVPTLFGAVGSVVVARATDINMCIAGFCVIGIAFGAQPLLHTVSSEVLPRKWRAYGQASDMVSNGLGSILGLLVGGAFNRTNDPTSEGFRNYFYMALALYAVSALLCIVVYHPPPRPLQKRLTNMEKLAQLDWVGYILLAAGLVLFCLGLSWSKNPYEWSDPHVSATFAVGLTLALALVVYETWFKKDGMFHHGLFNQNRNFSIVMLCVFAEGVAFFAANTYFAFQVSVLYETDAVLVGARYALMSIASMIGSILCGWYCAATHRLRWLTVSAFVIFVVFFVCMATTGQGSSDPVWFYPVLLGFALGMTLTTLITAAQLCIPHELIAIASGLVISVRSLGGTIGIAIYNVIFNDSMSHLSDNIANAVIPAGLSPQSLGAFILGLTSHDNDSIAQIPNITPEIIAKGANARLETYVVSFRHVWIAAACFVAVAAIAAAFLFDPKKEFNNRIDAPLEKEEASVYSA
ncbi:Trichothecene efflux pump TRI12 [Colletotrichum orbiculare MAFF 240422]|uniref:Trichothecene efflux pump TRI12 n=1 Tax=Colletotrichum orbiculare (strain 104-T / ATCC 96160 / CBS 514.97 / LARS 414 / MAFF 240422) TaxID=1213857 RepID=N4VK44_COLOR|nr:Trichothecene efflux pump TRI12 [Colletotrichum orbiculare MAFF 240422]